jgi:4-amino-4-deoxy-L-arabinose transferase-like glycosyltransferase
MRKVSRNSQFAIRNSTFSLILLLIVLLAAGLRLASLSRFPPGLHQDEAANAWNGYCLLKTGRDQVGVRWPLFWSRCLGANRSTLYLYALLPFQAIGGLDPWTTRLPSALGGVLTVLLTYYVGRRLFGRPTGLVAAGLMAVNPWHLQMSRWGHEAGLCPLLVMAPIAALLWANLWHCSRAVPHQGHGRPRVGIAAFAGGLAGICCYGYPAVRVFLPVFLAALVVVTWRAWRGLLASSAGRRGVGALVISGAVTFGPLAWVHMGYPYQIARRAEQLWVWDASDSIGTKVVKTLARYPGHFGPDFLFRPGDLRDFRFPTGAGQFHWYAGPLMIMGALTVVRRIRSSPAARVLLIWVLLYPVGDLFFGHAGMHGLRSLPGAGGLIILSAVGAVFVVQRAADFSLRGRPRGLKCAARRSAAGVVCILAVAVIGLNVQFLGGYFSDRWQSPEIRQRFHVEMLEACSIVRPRIHEFDAVFFTAQDVVEPCIITLVGLQYEPQQWFLDAPLALPTGDWDVYPGYGKIHFLFGDLGQYRLRELATNGQPDRVLFIVQPGELALQDPTFEITGAHSEPKLWICEETM